MALTGGFVAACPLLLPLKNLAKPVRAWLAVMTFVAMMIALAGTAIGGAVCSTNDFVDVGQCHEDRHGTETSYDSDWHGWPVPWRTDMPLEGQRQSDWDETPIMVGSGGASLPLLVISLALWFTTSFVAEGTVIGSWRALRRLHYHHTLFVRA